MTTSRYTSIKRGSGTDEIGIRLCEMMRDCHELPHLSCYLLLLSFIDTSVQLQQLRKRTVFRFTFTIPNLEVYQVNIFIGCIVYKDLSI